MVTIEEAIALVEKFPLATKTEFLSLRAAQGRVLATAIHSPMSLPSFDNSAMDGYAVRGIYYRYKLIGTKKAGETNEIELAEGEACRIFTGAKIPLNAESVIMQEHVEVSTDELVVHKTIIAGSNIRRRGEELNTGDLIFEKGHKLNAAGIGLLSSLGLTDVEVVTAPKIGILLTGDELVSAGTPLLEGQIYEGNGASLCAALAKISILPIEVRRVADDLEQVDQAVGELLENSDLLLISGGISVGDFDFVSQALSNNAVDTIFYKVEQKPGKPLFFGRKDGKRVFAMPGNPASLLTCYYVYVELLLKTSRYLLTWNTNSVGYLTEKQEVKGTRPAFFRVKREGSAYKILDKQSSSMLHAFAKGEALVLLYPGINEVDKPYRIWHY